MSKYVIATIHDGGKKENFISLEFGHPIIVTDIKQATVFNSSEDCQKKMIFWFSSMNDYNRFKVKEL